MKKQDGDCDIEFEEEDRKHVPPTSRGKFLKDVTNKHKKQRILYNYCRKVIIEDQE